MLDIRLEGEADLFARLDKATSRLQRPRELFDDIAATLERNINVRFDTKKDPSGSAWPGLAPSTRVAYAKADNGKRAGTLLERTGLGRASLNSRTSDTFAEIGFGRPYMGYHETGTRKMQRRGLLAADAQGNELGTDDRNDLLDVIEDWTRGLFD